MDEDTIKDLKEQYDNLPPEVQKAISDTDLPTKLQQIVKNNKLLIDQAGILETETNLVLYGIEPLNDYVNNLIRELHISKDQALAIAHDANELIFKDVRDTLQQISSEIIAAENEAVKTPGTPSKEETLAGIENPAQIQATEQSVSLSSLGSNNPASATPDENLHGIEIRKSMVPEIAPEAMLPIKPAIPFHENVSPVENIVQAKMTDTVAVPTEKIVVEEKTKLPEKEASRPTDGVDPYREAIN